MQVVTGNRRSGKTTKLLDMAIDDALEGMDVVFVAFNKMMADRIKKILMKSDVYEAIKDNIFVSYFCIECCESNSIRELTGRHFDRIYIDDLNYIVEKIFNSYISNKITGLDPICVSIDTTTLFEKKLLVGPEKEKYESRLEVSPYY